jgi:hypothetical protein
MPRPSCCCPLPLLGLVAALALGASVPAHATVGLDGNLSIVNADIGSSPSPPYLVSMDVIADPTWTTAWLSDPISLTGDHSVGADAEAWFADPFDTTAPYDLIPIPFTATALGRATYDASAGHLHASASALASLTPSSYVAVAPDAQPPVEITSPYLGGAFAGLRIYYSDDVTFTSASLAVGAPIQIEMTVYHHTDVSSSAGLGGGPPYPNQAYSESRLQLSTYDADWNPTSLGGDPFSVLRSETIDGTPVRDDPGSAVFHFDAAVGDHFYLNHSLEVWARATVDAALAMAGSVADSSNTAGVSLRALTEGVTIESTSGNDYTETLPEPGAALLPGTALLAILCLRRRRG